MTKYSVWVDLEVEGESADAVKDSVAASLSGFGLLNSTIDVFEIATGEEDDDTDDGTGDYSDEFSFCGCEDDHS